MRQHKKYNNALLGVIRGHHEGVEAVEWKKHVRENGLQTIVQRALHPSSCCLTGAWYLTSCHFGVSVC